MSRFTVSTAPLAEVPRRAVQLYVDCAGARATWAEVVDGLEHDPELGAALSEALAAVPFAAFFWETSPVSAATTQAIFACAVVESRALSRVSADPAPFAQHFVRPDGPPMRVFANLGRDALLVVPFPPADPAPVAHLATWVRGVGLPRRDQLWTAVGRALRGRLGRDRAPVWVSTSGLGVSWLHVRLDRQPKYYTWAPFRAPPRS